MVIMLLDDAQQAFGKAGLITGCTVNVKDTSMEGVAAVRAAIEGPIAEKCGLKGKIRVKSPSYAPPSPMPSGSENWTSPILLGPKGTSDVQFSDLTVTRGRSQLLRSKVEFTRTALGIRISATSCNILLPRLAS